MDTHDLPLAFRLTLHEYREHLAARGLRPLTVSDYAEKALPFLRYLLSRHVEDFREVGLETLESYRAFLLEPSEGKPPLKLRTVALRLSQVKAFFRFLYKTGRIYQDTAAGLVLPKRTKSLPKGILDVAEAESLLTHVDLSTPLGIRDRAILELLYSSGLRNTEIRSLEVYDVDLKARIVFVRGKGGKEALVPFGFNAQKALAHYLHFARPHLVVARKHKLLIGAERAEAEAGREYFFLSRNGHRIALQNLIDLMRRHVKAAGLSRTLSPHSLRHTCATHLLKGGADIRHIQKLLRHASLTSTQIYTHLLIEDLKNAQARYHPREKMDA